MRIQQDEGKSFFPKLHLAIICFINHFSIIINVPMATTFAMVCLIYTYKFSFFVNSILIFYFNFHFSFTIYFQKRYYETILFWLFKIDLLKTQAWSQDGQMFQEGHTMLACSRLHRKNLVDKGLFYYLFIYLAKQKSFHPGSRGDRYPHLSSSGSQLEHRNRFTSSACGNSNITSGIFVLVSHFCTNKCKRSRKFRLVEWLYSTS